MKPWAFRSLIASRRLTTLTLWGTDPVSAMVVFVDGKPSKDDYRKYKIKTAQGGDDYGSMQEVIYRRYSRVLKEKLPFPDLIVIDGGKGQVGAAQDVLHNQLGLDIPVAGLVKTINIKPVSYCLAMICSRFSSNEIQSNSFAAKNPR